MSRLSPHFNRSEFACRCHCDFDTVDAELLVVLEDVREHFNSPVTINSAARCIMHNANEGGSYASQHIYGRAADIVVVGFTPDEVYHYLSTKYPNKYGMGSYSTFTHIDTRRDRARWAG